MGLLLEKIDEEITDVYGGFLAISLNNARRNNVKILEHDYFEERTK